MEEAHTVTSSRKSSMMLPHAYQKWFVSVWVCVHLCVCVCMRVQMHAHMPAHSYSLQCLFVFVKSSAHESVT